MSVETVTLTLPCGGVLSLVVEANWLAMSDADLAFVRDLSGRMNAHLAPAVDDALTWSSPPDEPEAPVETVEDVDPPAPALPDPPAEPVRRPGPGAPRTCNVCGVQYETAAALLNHDCDPTRTATCDACGKVCGSRAGLAQHRKFKHPGKGTLQTAPAPLPAPVVMDPAPEPDEPALRVAPTILAGLETAADLDPEALAAAFADQPVRTGTYRFTGTHEITLEHHHGREHRCHCACGWVTLPYPTEDEMRVAFDAHAADMAMARAAMPADDWTPPVTRAAPAPTHRLAEARREGGGHIAICLCGWRTPYPVGQRSDATERLRDHIDDARDAA